MQLEKKKGQKMFNGSPVHPYMRSWSFPL